MNKARVVIVDENDNVVGVANRGDLISKGLIHRIVRVLLFNSKGQVFLQKRNANKDTWPNKWDQSVGGHVDEGEDYDDAVVREMSEELGVKGINLTKLVKYYTEDDTDGKMKKRFNMLYKGIYDGEIKLEKEEISKGGWYNVDDIDKWMRDNPNDFTPGCIRAFEEYKKIN